MTQTWKNEKGEVAIELTIDDVEGIILKINNEENLKHRSELLELQTLNMYPPKDEEKMTGTVSEDGQWTTYETRPGQNWEYAKKDIVATCDFWMGELTSLL